jgi:hypothetical protein
LIESVWTANVLEMYLRSNAFSFRWFAMSNPGR